MKHKTITGTEWTQDLGDEKGAKTWVEPVKTVPEIVDDRPAIRAALRESRLKRGVRVRTQSYLP